MKRTTIEFMIGWLDALRRGDAEALKATLAPDVVWQGLRDEWTCHGPDAVIDTFAGERDAKQEIGALELIGADDHVILHASGGDIVAIEDIPLPDGIYNVFTLDGGTITRIDDYADRHDALTAAGLSRSGGFVEARVDRPHAVSRGGMDDKVNLAAALQAFDDAYGPRIVGHLNDYKVAVVKARGEFVWHKHDETDDFFLVLHGRLTIQLRDRDIELAAGEMFIVPRGVEHCPRADDEAHVLLIEPRGTPNTGDAGGPLTAPEREL